MENNLEPIPQTNIITNKGTGAGGSNTNYYGKIFEEKTNNQSRLINNGYTKNNLLKKPKKTIYTKFMVRNLNTKTKFMNYKKSLAVLIMRKDLTALFVCITKGILLSFLAIICACVPAVGI